MQVVEKRLDELQPYENNPRKNDRAVEYVANSIKEFGFRNPIIIDKDGVIVAGHTRYLAAIELGIDKVPTISADDLTPEQVKAYRLADNKVAEYSSWDFALLDEELENLELDMSDFGFAEYEVDWEDIADIEDEGFVEPEHDRLRCPICGGIDYKMHFKKVDSEGNEE